MLAPEVLAIARVDRLGDGDQAQRGLHVAARLDPPAGQRDGDVFLALEVLVGRLGGHRHPDLRVPVDLVRPLPVQVAVLAVLGGADVDREVVVGELEALRHVRVAQLRPHVWVAVHHREDLVDHLDELVLRLELDLRHQLLVDDELLDAADLRRVAAGLAFGPVVFAAVLAALGLAGAFAGAFAVVARLAGARRADVVFAGAAAAGLATCFSSSATRRESASISARSPRTSSSTRRSSKLSRIRCAADATSSSRLRPRSRAPSVPPVVAWKVRSTAPRTASTTSAGSRPLSFFAAFLSFLGMVAAVYVSVTAAATIHLRPHDAVAERVLVPGDPGRALRLAQLLLEQPKMLNHNRGLWGYSGAAPDGAPLTIQSTGMGGPSAAIVLEELIELGARRIVRVGTCGALVDALALGDLVVADGVLAEDGTSRALGAAGTLRPDPDLQARLRAAAGDAATGLVVSSDLFYDPDPERAQAWARAGALAVEMEAATLLAVAARRGVAAAIVLAVSDLVADATRIAPDALEAAEAELGRPGLSALAG